MHKDPKHKERISKQFKKLKWIYSPKLDKHKSILGEDVEFWETKGFRLGRRSLPTSQETRDKISETLMGHKVTQETRDKISETLKLNNKKDK
ncbi:MAG: hypothetical protein J7L15_09475 [Clostridiales bacterium]|nr:hypothetical protein [Clostridiales bacterium]